MESLPEGVDAAFREMNAVWAADGPTGLGRLYPLPYFRAEMMGLDHTEVARILSQVRTFFDDGRNGDWIETWSTAGAEYSERALRAEEDGREATAGDYYLAATACYFVAAYTIHAFQPIMAREVAFVRAHGIFALAGQLATEDAYDAAYREAGAINGNMDTLRRLIPALRGGVL